MSSKAVISSSVSKMAASSSSTKIVSKKVSSSSAVTSKTYSYRSGAAPDDSNVTIEYIHDVSNVSRLEDKIRLLMEDIEYERELRQRVEREKADLSVQVIQLSERIEEVEAGADGQIEINKKRDAELAKLRKLLEDVHLESEQTHHMLKKKHQEAVVDFQDQIDILTKAKNKIEKEKSKFQAEVYELTQQLEKVTLESAGYHKSVKSLSISIQELNIKIEELNRTIVDITSAKQRLSVENVELTKVVQEYKVKIEELNYTIKSGSTSADEWRRRYEQEEARRRKLESELHSLNNELNALKRSYDEECELRIDIERKYNSEVSLVQQFKSKYESECRIRVEEIEEIKKKMTARIVELEEHCTSLNQKVANVEKQKSRLSQEIEIMILDLEKANTNHREVKSRLEIVDREYKTLVVKYEELNLLYEQTSKDLKIRIAEYNKVTQEYEHNKELYEKLSVDHRKIASENSDLKSSCGDLGRIKHELEVEVRRLEAERNELATALHEADAARKDEETRFIKITNEYQSYRIEIEKRLHIREEELESVRKQMAIEVDALNARVVERLRSASSSSSIKSVDSLHCGSPLHHSVRDTALFPGYEVAGTVEALGVEVTETDLQVGDRVIVYPYEGHPPGYAEYIAVPDVQYLIKVPENMNLSTAAMLPSGALWAMNTVFSAHNHVEKVLSEKGETGQCKILLVGTGGLALWAMRIARFYWPQKRDRIVIAVACLRDEGISIAQEYLRVNVVQWNEDLYEEQLVERTKDACGGPVDIVIDFSATSRSIRRALKCLAPGGVMLVSSEHSEGLISRYSSLAEKENHQLIPIEFGTLNQLRNLVHLVSTGEIEPPPHTIFSADRANEALAKIGRGLIPGRAILEFPEDDEDEEE